MKNNIIILIFVVLTTITKAQNDFNTKVLDSKSNEALVGATVILKGTNNTEVTDLNGLAKVKNIPNGEQTILITSLGYEDMKLILRFPIQTKKYLPILLYSNKEKDEIIIESTRVNRRSSDIPTKTEVLTKIDEMSSIESSKIAQLITQCTGTQVQITAAGINGAMIKTQGLNGRYTKILKDGFPLYGGLSGNLDILQIPPLDLRKIEYIKGPSSTFYGEGSISGIINLISKKATIDETLLQIDFSTIGAKNFNAFISRRLGKWGFTNLASMKIHNQYDADKDGFSDIAQVSKFNFNPKLFYHPNKRTDLYLGANISKENRIGGDMDVIRYNNSIGKYYSETQESNRFATQLYINHKLSDRRTISLKNSFSNFYRYIKINENILEPFSNTFSGNQYNNFTELNLNINNKTQNINIGLNTLSNSFKEKEYMSNSLRNQAHKTVGLYVNHLWDVSSKFALESGLRAEKVDASTLNKENKESSFVLPNLSALYKITREVSVRFRGGMGYKIPTIFNEESEPYGYKNIQAINLDDLVAEESYGTNIDFQYQSSFFSDNVSLLLNQMFFYNIIDNPITLDESNINNLIYHQVNDSLFSKGYESQVKLTIGKFSCFLGYTYTDSYFENREVKTRLKLTPKHSIKGNLLFVSEDKWRIGWNYDYKSSQSLKHAIKTEDLFTTGIIVERTIANFVIFLNAQNLTNVKQSNMGSLLTNGSPQFTEIWSPLAGRFFNGGLKIKL
ncbi:MAG: hypothetical protein CMD16_05345 [Flavobacteriales bacterium]|nr:hypothetical protein [Flavobacteriales bacterium]|tara:strand:- start:11715 stop:13916 length:2202 start_codon:yes stop_codon:yes gene_type:complete